MLIKVLMGVAVIGVGAVAVVETRPSQFRVARSTVIAAPPPAVFAQVNDFHKWNAWNPWAKIDPAMKQAYAGAPAGVGAVYTWAGNRKVGEGRMTVVESRPPDLIRVELEFVKPIAGASLAEFTFRPEGAGTLVTWSMVGQNGFLAKAIHMVIDMDKMVGGNFEKGLAAMKAAVETATPRS